MADWEMEEMPRPYGKIHISIGDYEFIEVEVAGNYEEIVQAGRELQRLQNGASGLPAKDFNRFLDRMLQGEGNHVEEFEKMSDIQKIVVNEVKKALKRASANYERHSRGE